MDNQETKTTVPATPGLPGNAPAPAAATTPATPTLPGNAPAPNAGLPGNAPSTPAVSGNEAEPALPGDAPKAQELDLSKAQAGKGAATKEAGLTGMVTFDYNNTPITDIVNSIILDSIDKGVSDIHMDPFEEGIKIRIRIDGKLHDYSIVPLYVKRNLVTRIKIISGMNITESRIPQDGAIRTTINEQPIDIRVSVLPTNLGEKVVMRIMDYTMSDQGIDHIDISEFNLEKIHRMMTLPNGIILVTGATGSGKSTTVYSILQALNDEETNIITVEDPVEMNIEGINQVMVNSDIGLTFASVLRSILRQDPDVIMVGEIRDEETARIAVRSAITGHLVLSTIHTNNALNTIERLTDMNVERYLLGSALSGIVSQKLARRLCTKCKRLRPTTEYEKDVIQKTLHEDVKEIYEPVGCPECSKGYRGRIAVHEVLLLNQAVRDAITANISKTELRKVVYGAGGTKTMLEDGLAKCIQGHTSFDEVLKLIDLDDDLGADTQLGLKDQMEDAATNDATTEPKKETKPAAPSATDNKPVEEKKDETKPSSPTTPAPAEEKKEEAKPATPATPAPTAEKKDEVKPASPTTPAPAADKKEEVKPATTPSSPADKMTAEANKLPGFLAESPLMAQPAKPAAPAPTPSTTPTTPAKPAVPTAPSAPAAPAKPATPASPAPSSTPSTPANPMASVLNGAPSTINKETSI